MKRLKYLNVIFLLLTGVTWAAPPNGEGGKAREPLGLELALEDAFRSELLLVLGGLKPAGEFKQDQVRPGSTESIRVIYSAMKSGALKTSNLLFQLQTHPYSVSPNKDLVVVNTSTLAKRILDPEAKQILDMYGISGSATQTEIIRTLTENFFRMNGSFHEGAGSIQENLLPGFLFGFPLRDVLSYALEHEAETRPDRRHGAFWSIDKTWIPFSFVTYGSQSQKELQNLRNQAVHLQKIRSWARAQGVSNQEIWNHWDTLAKDYQDKFGFCEASLADAAPLVFSRR